MWQRYDVIVVGGGHAGCEAALAAARLGMETLLITLQLDAIARMSCNPSMGGPAKGHLIREIDALGGAMGEITDRAAVNFRMLNTGRGPAVQALRSQSDRARYSLLMKQRLEQTPHLSLYQGEVVELLVGEFETAPEEELAERPGRSPRSLPWQKQRERPTHFRQPLYVRGVRLSTGEVILAPRVVLCTGTFLGGRLFIGETTLPGGRMGEPASMALEENLRKLGLRFIRLKTGTSPRLDGRTVDFSRLEVQLSRPYRYGFSSFKPLEGGGGLQLPCWITRTRPETIAVLRKNLERSALFAGLIAGPGPRYCPSIEDKVKRFPQNLHHPIFVEPDGLATTEIYLQGLSTSLPLEVQYQMLATIPGLERAHIVRPGYAVEYSVHNPIHLTRALESELVAGLFMAGNLCGTTGYEEAGAQGLVAGANAALTLAGREPLPLTRETGYIGTLIDDLTTKGVTDPYRMFTARCEFRLLCRFDNALTRLSEIAHRAGLLPEAKWRRAREVLSQVEELREALGRERLSREQLAQAGLPAGEPRSVLEALQFPATTLERLRPVMSEELLYLMDSLDPLAVEQVEIEARYRGYLERQLREVEQLRESEAVRIPPDFDFDQVESLSAEAKEKLSKVRPETLGQAGRIPGVDPADLQALLFALSRGRGRGARRS